MIVRRMRWLTRCRVGHVKRRGERALFEWCRRGWSWRHSPPGPNSLEKRLRGNAGPFFPAMQQLLYFALELRVVRSLGKQGLIDTQGIPLMALLQVELGHRLRQNRFRLRECRRISGAIIVGDRACPRLWRRRRRGGRGARRRGGPTPQFIVRPAERQIDPRGRIVPHWAPARSTRPVRAST